MLIDIAEVTFKGGNGGNGKVSFRKHMKGPDGGNGGDGGNLYVVAKPDLKLLNQFSRETIFSAENGITCRYKYY
jgi:GTP-binding protein